MHENFLLGSLFKFIYFLVVGYDNSGTYLFLTDILFKGCQGRSNRSSIVHVVSYFACGVNDTACTVHGVSLTPHAFLTFFACHRCFAYDFHFSKLFEKCGVNDTACTVHAVSMTPHAF
jgi:hypothetical protein